MTASPIVERLIRQLEARGLTVKPGREPGQLLLCGPDREKTPELLKGLKDFKAELLEVYGTRAEPDHGPPRDDVIQTPTGPEPAPGEPSPPAGPPALVRCSECRGLVRPGAVLCVTDWPEERPQAAVTGQWAHLHQPALGLMTRPLCPHSTPPPSSPASTGSGPN